jgi:hypothetical protein
VSTRLAACVYHQSVALCTAGFRIDSIALGLGVAWLCSDLWNLNSWALPTLHADVIVLLEHPAENTHDETTCERQQRPSSHYMPERRKSTTMRLISPKQAAVIAYLHEPCSSSSHWQPLAAALALPADQVATETHSDDCSTSNQSAISNQPS